MNLPRYPEYKSSGVEWLASVPAHWTVAPVKRGYDVCLGKMLQTDRSGEGDVLAPYLRSANIQWGSVDTSDVKTMWFTPKDREQLALLPGDLLISEGGDVGRSAIWRDDVERCFIQNSVNRVRSTGHDLTTFLYYWMVAIKYAGYVDVLCNKSTIAHFTAEKLASVPVPFPPAVEQHAIVAFLDRETAKIDALIGEQEKLLALLTEKRQATISHAVTRGLNSDSPLKDSGIPWLGELPAHWEVRALKTIVSTPITDGPHETPEFLDDGVPFVSAEAVSSGKIDFSKIRGHISREDNARYSQKYKPELHDIYVVKSGATTGVTAIVDGRIDFNIWSPLAVIRCNRAVADPVYILQFLRSRNFQEGVALNWSFGTQQNIGMGVLGDLAVALPPLEEQERVARVLGGGLDDQAALMASAQAAIPLLRERRSALIAAAVTGQVDVRGTVKAQAA